MPSASKTGIITGGASGMGLETAKVLSANGWTLHLFDLNKEGGTKAAQELPKATFHEVDVTKWESLSTAFDEVFNTAGSIDFVFANAGIVERNNFYAKVDARPPPRVNQLSIDINYKAVVDTAYLAQHYFRSSPHKGKDATLIMTASCGAFYPSQFSPMYAGGKAAVVNFMRSIAFPYYHNDGIRTYAICPGTVRTGLLSSKEWEMWPEDYFTKASKIASTVEMLVNGGVLEDSVGKKTDEDTNWGLAVEINRDNVYFRDQVEYCDDAMRHMMRATSMEHQLSGFKN